MAPSKFTKSNVSNTQLDTRDDLGYGRLSPRFHVPRDHGDPTFPYIEPATDVDDVEVDEDTIDVISLKTQLPDGNGDQGGGHYDPFYYVAGNTKLGEALGLAPFPGMYKNKSRTATGAPLKGRTARADGSTMSPTIDPGEKTGWSTQYDTGPDADEPIENLEDLADKQLRECIQMIIRSELRNGTWAV